MLDFRDIRIEDRDIVQECIIRNPRMQCDISFEQIYLWRKDYRLQIGFYKDFFICKCFIDGPCFFFPTGGTDYACVINELKNYCRDSKIDLRFTFVIEEDCDIIKNLFPGEFEFKELRDNFDYIHDISKIASYSGNSLARKRCSCNSFMKKYRWEYKQLEAGDIDKCRSFMESWKIKNKDRMDASIAEEYLKIGEAFDNFNRFGFVGGILKAEDKICAYTFGKMIRDDVFDIFYEKADVNVYGSYPMLSREFAKWLKNRYPHLKYLNREDDMGLPNLRKSKELYYPDFMLKKCEVTYIDDIGVKRL